MLVLFCILIPFVGTVLGAAAVFLYRGRSGYRSKVILNGLAAGVMIASAFFSLLIPALEGSVILSLSGVFSGVLFFCFAEWLADRLMPVSHLSGRRSMAFWAITLHNLPEGMAVGIAAAGFFMGADGMTAATCIALAVGIAIQNIPEGAIVSLPLKEKKGKTKAFGAGVTSGIVEPIGAFLAMILSESTAMTLPFFLAFAAGAMLAVAVGELALDLAGGGMGGKVAFAVGLTLMTALDVILA